MGRHQGHPLLWAYTHPPAGIKEREDYQDPEGQSPMEKDSLAFLLKIQPKGLPWCSSS